MRFMYVTSLSLKHTFLWDFMATYDSFGHGCFWRTLKNQCRAWEGAALSPGACVQDTELGQIVYNPSWSLRSAVKFILEKSKAINILCIEMRFAQLKTCCRFSVLAAATDLSVHCLITFQFLPPSLSLWLWTSTGQPGHEPVVRYNYQTGSEISRKSG